MATVTRFVLSDGINTAGGNGTTNTNTGVNRAYLTLSEWESNEQTDLVTDTDVHVVNCSGAVADTTGNVQINGWTTGVSNFITVNADNSAGKYDTGSYRIEYTATGNYQEGIAFVEAFTICNDMQIQGTNTTNNEFDLYRAFTTNIQILRCIARGVVSGGFTKGFATTQADVTDTLFRACLAYDFDNAAGDSGFRGLTSVAANVVFDNCTAHNCVRGFETNANDTDLRNCLAQNCTDGFNGTFQSADSCCSDIVSDAPGTNTQTGDVVFVNEAGDDFQIAAADTVAKENGADLSGTFTFDLAGNTWPATWSIGCLIPAAAAVTGQTIYHLPLIGVG